MVQRHLIIFFKYEFVPDHAIPSLFGYIIALMISNCATWSLFREHQFRRWAKLTSIFLIIPFLLDQQTWFRVCVLSVVPITFRFSIHLTWCHRRSITSSWNLSTNVSWSSSTLWALPGYQWNSWWERPSLPSMISIIIDHSTTFPPTQTCSCFVLYLEFLAIQQLFFFTLEYYHLLCQVCRKNFTTSYDILVQWYFSPSLFFLGPRVVSKRNTDQWSVMCKF